MANFQLNLKKNSDGSNHFHRWLQSFLTQRKGIIESLPALPALLKPIGINDPGLIKNLLDASEQFKFKDIIKTNWESSPKYSIALLDTGVWINHPDFRSNSIERLCSNNDPAGVDVDDEHGHGTHIAGIMAANGIGEGRMRGVVPGAPIVSYKITNGKDSSTTWVNIANALEAIINRNKDSENKISVVNLSFNAFNNLKGNGPEEVYSPRIQELIQDLADNDIPVVVSGGNYYDAFPHGAEAGVYGLAFPANLKDVIACGASCIEGSVIATITRADGVTEDQPRETKTKDLAPFTQRPYPYDAVFKEQNKIFITTPAIATQSTNNSNERPYSILVGSSMAAPVITGHIFLLQQINLKLNGTLPDLDSITNSLREMCTGMENKGESHFRNSIKTSAFFDSKLYLHLTEAETIKHFTKLMKAKSIAQA